MRDYVMPPASYSQIISLLSIDEVNAYTAMVRTFPHDYFVSCYWSDFKKHDSFVSWYNNLYNKSCGYKFLSYESAYNAILFNPTTFYDYCKICEYISQVYIQRANTKKNKRDKEVRDNQIMLLKKLAEHIQSLQDNDINTLISILESDKDIASRLILETPTEKMLEPTHTLV